MSLFVMNVRKHRGTLEESMKTAAQVTTWEEFKAYWEEDEIGGFSNYEAVHQGVDPRTDWIDTYLIVVDTSYVLNGKPVKERGVMGMSDKPIPAEWHD